LTRVLFDPTRRYFFEPEGKKIEKFGNFRVNFLNPNQILLTQPEQQSLFVTFKGLEAKINNLLPKLFFMLTLIQTTFKKARQTEYEF